MRVALAILSLVLLAFSTDWQYSGFVRLKVSSSDIGIARAIGLRSEETYQSRITFRTRKLPKERIEILFLSGELRYLADGMPETTENLADILESRRLVLEKGPHHYELYDDPDHLLDEKLPFDPNLLCLLLDLAVLTMDFTENGDSSKSPQSINWSMPYINQSHAKVLEELDAKLPAGLGDNKTFVISLNRDESQHEKQKGITSIADGLGDGYISRNSSNALFFATATIRLQRSIHFTEDSREGRLSATEDIDFLLEPLR